MSRGLSAARPSESVLARFPLAAPPPRLVAHPLLQRLHAARDVAGLVRRASERIVLGLLAHRGARFANLLRQVVEVRPDGFFHRARLRRLAQRGARVADHLADALVADAARGFVELPRRVALVAPDLVRQLLELVLQILDLLIHCVLALGERLRLGLAREARLLIEAGDVVRDVLLVARKLLGVLLQLLQIAIAARALIAPEPLLR